MDVPFPYILFHFRQVYQVPDFVEIGYGKESGAKVRIQETASDFFTRKDPYPATVLWKDWEGTPLPLFFEASVEQAWFLEELDGRVLVRYDLAAASFFLLSGWQERYSTDRDSFGRFPYAASVQAKHGFIKIPVVNHYFDILKAAVEIAYGIPIPLRTWQGKLFATCLTHDIDYCQSAWKVAGKAALQEGNLPLFLRLAGKKVLGRDEWFNFGQVEKELERLQAPGTFFFLPESSPYQGHPNADYQITSSRIVREMDRLRKKGHAVALHGSHGAGSEPGRLSRDIGKFPFKIHGNRFHYLRFSPEDSLPILQAESLDYDSSLGFPEHFGFRHSFCHPFRLYDFKNSTMSGVWEVSLILMDITLHHPRYLQIPADEVLPSLLPVFQQIRRFQGVFTLLWHNENFTPSGLPDGLRIFRDLTDHLSREGTCFQSIPQVLAHR